MHVVVDLDNLYIINNKVSPKTLISRVKILINMFSNFTISFFGNSYTQGLLDKFNLSEHVKFYSSDIETNSADHNLINYIGKMRDKKIIVVSSDVTLCRIARYIHEGSKQIAFIKFDAANNLGTFPIDFKFNRKEHLEKFITSLALYNTRYPSKKYASLL